MGALLLILLVGGRIDAEMYFISGIHLTGISRRPLRLVLAIRGSPGNTLLVERFSVNVVGNVVRIVNDGSVSNGLRSRRFLII